MSTGQLQLDFPSPPKEYPSIGGPLWAYLTGTRPEHYPTTHCWHYLMGGIPLYPDTIKSSRDWKPAKPTRKPEKVAEHVRRSRAELRNCLDNYRKMLNGEFPRTGPCWTNVRLDFNVSLSLRRSHIAYAKGELSYWTRLQFELKQKPAKRS